MLTPRPALRSGLSRPVAAVLLALLLAVAALVLPASTAGAAVAGGRTAATAVPLPISVPGSFQADNTGSSTSATYSLSSPPYWHNTTWYSYTPTRTGRVSIRATSISPAGWDNTLEVWTASGQLVEQRDDTYGLDALVTPLLQAGVTYRIGLGAWGGDKGTALLTFGTASPDAPTDVRAVAGAGRAQLSWVAPADNGSPITRYTVYCAAGDREPTVCATVNGAPPATSVTVPNLGNGAAYTFRVTASSYLGESAQSEPSEAVRPRADQTITFEPLPALTYAQAAVDLTATASSGLPVSYAADGACRVDGTELAVTDTGTCTVTARQAGDDATTAAADVVRVTEVGKGLQTITFDQLRVLTVGARPVAPAASASSGLPISFDADGACVLDDGRLQATGVGQCTVTARQDGNERFEAAEAVVQSTDVVAPAPSPVVPEPPNLPEPPQPTAPSVVPDLPGLPLTPAPTPSQTPATPTAVRVQLDVSADAVVGSARFAVEATGLRGGSPVQVEAHSTPRLLAEGTADPLGRFTRVVTLPADLEPGDHNIVVTATGADGKPVEGHTPFSVSADGRVSTATTSGTAVTETAERPVSQSADPVVPQLLADAPTSSQESVDLADAVVPQPLADAPAGSEEPASADADASSAAARSLPAMQPVAGLARFSPLAHPEGVVSLSVSAFALLAVATSGVASAVQAAGSPVPTGSPAPGSAARGAVTGPSGGRRKGGKVAGLKAKHLKFRPEGNRPGDTSRLWRWPGTEWLDAASYSATLALATRSPLASRVVNDGSALRAMFGSLTLLLPATGVVLGILAAGDTSGAALPPSFGLLAAVVALGVLDALAGLMALILFAGIVVVSGGVTDVSSVRTLMGVGVLFIGPALLGGAFRPIRRGAATTSADWWERVIDLVAVPLVGGWAAQKMVLALPGLSGYDLPVVEHADTIALIVVAGLVLRVLAEEAVARWFPERLAATAPGKVPFASPRQRLTSTALRTASFVFVAIAFLGPVWQLWVGAALFALPAVIAIWEHRLPNVPRIWQALPAGVPKIGVMLLVGTAASAALKAAIGTDPDYARQAFVLLTIPGLLLGALGFFGRDPVDGDTRWYQRPRYTVLYRAGGVVVLVCSIWLAVTL